MPARRDLYPVELIMENDHTTKRLGNQLLKTNFMLQPPNRLSLPPIPSKFKQHFEPLPACNTAKLPHIKEKPRVTYNFAWSDKRLKHGRPPPLTPRKAQELAASINSTCQYSTHLEVPASLTRAPPKQPMNNIRNIKRGSISSYVSQNDSNSTYMFRGSPLMSPSEKLELSPQTGAAFSYDMAMKYNKPRLSAKKNVNSHNKRKSLTPGTLPKKVYTTQLGGKKDDDVLCEMHSFSKGTSEVVDEQISDDQRIEMRQKLQEEVTKITLLEDQDYLVNFTPKDSQFNALVQKYRGGIANSLEHLTDEIRGEHEQFLNEVDEVTYYAHRQAEAVLACRSDIHYSPRTVLLISSSVPKPHLLIQAAKPEVLCAIYDFYQDNYTALLDELEKKLNEYLEGAKIKHLGIVCKGGPGYMYLLRKKPITPAKLAKERDLLKFWKTLGSYMSKISNTEKSVIHLMESNVAGNKQGEELLVDLEAVMYAHRVKVVSPLEISYSGREMINTYFIMEKFKTWKSKRYTKTKLF